MLAAKPAGNRGRGRPKGTPNKATTEVRALAQEYGPSAIRRLAVLGGLVPANQLRQGEVPSTNETTITLACTRLLERAYGYPSQPMEHSAGEGWEEMLDRLSRK